MQIALGFHLEQRVNHVTQTSIQKERTMNQIDTILTQIARKHLDIETLQTRHADSLDFHDTAVWCLKDALEAAFKAGVNSAQQARRPRKRKSPEINQEVAQSGKNA